MVVPLLFCAALSSIAPGPPLLFGIYDAQASRPPPSFEGWTLASAAELSARQALLVDTYNEAGGALGVLAAWTGRSCCFAVKSTAGRGAGRGNSLEHLVIFGAPPHAYSPFQFPARRGGVRGGGAGKLLCNPPAPGYVQRSLSLFGVTRLAMGMRFGARAPGAQSDLRGCRTNRSAHNPGIWMSPRARALGGGGGKGGEGSAPPLLLKPMGVVPLKTVYVTGIVTMQRRRRHVLHLNDRPMGLVPMGVLPASDGRSDIKHGS